MSRVLRGIHKFIGMVLGFVISPFFIIGGFYASFLGRFADFNMILAYVPFYLGEYLRYFYYKALLKKVGKNVVFKYGSYCQYREAEIGNNCLIGYFNAIGLVKMGDDVLVGGYVNFTSGLRQHSFSDPTKKIHEQPGRRRLIVIGSDSWIGNNSVICASIGERTVIGAGSLVVKDLEGYGVYVGSPAKLVKKLDGHKVS